MNRALQPDVSPRRRKLRRRHGAQARGAKQSCQEAKGPSCCGFAQMVQYCDFPTDLPGGEDDPIADLTALREQMVRALAQLDSTLEQLKKPQVR
jgi:hypothetical protein